MVALVDIGRNLFSVIGGSKTVQMQTAFNKLQSSNQTESNVWPFEILFGEL